MFGSCLRYIIVVTLVVSLYSQPGLRADERLERVAEGKAFLSKDRLRKWESVFTEGIPSFGRILVTMDGKTSSEAWFDKEYTLMRYHETGNRKITYISNPDYLAEIRSRGSENRIYGVHPSASKSGLVYVDYMPFAINSSVSFLRLLIPQHLMSNKLTIYDYRLEGKRHIIDLEYTEEPEDKGKIELIFDDDISPLLPVKTTFGKGTQYVRCVVSSDFREVAGFVIPHKLEEINTQRVPLVTSFFPTDRLDPAMCWLAYYGLPEPGEMNVSDFGRNKTPWLMISLIALGVAGVSTLAYVVARRRMS